MSEIKLEAGQWYRLLDGRIGFCIGEGPKNGDIHYDNYPMLLVFNYAGDAYGWYTIGGVSADETDGCDLIEHLPDCTGFDWEEPKPEPKLQLREGAWYERKDGEIVGPCLPYKNPSWAPEANWEVCGRWYSDDGQNPAPETNLIREVDPPKKEYRAFASAEEFKPFRDKWLKYKVSDSNRCMSIRSYSDDGIGVAMTYMTYQKAMLELVFEDGSPFGVPCE